MTTVPAAGPKKDVAKADAKAKGKKAPVAKAPKKPLKIKDLFFAGEVVNVDIVNEAVEKNRLKKILRVVQIQVVIIALMTGFIIMGGPFFQTVYQYYAVDSNRHSVRLSQLYMPNMTNQAIVSWATNSITEIMTFGFGDYIPHLRAQQMRFTPEGWKGFVSAFDKMQLGKTFRERQLVLTTVPSDTAVILSQGPSLQHVYEWKMQMPVVMTYATNDNITHRDRAIIELVISRVPTADNPGGVAIKTWALGQ